MRTTEELRRRLLQEYAEPAPTGTQNGDRLFHRLLASHVVAILGLGVLLLTIPVAPAARGLLSDARPTPFKVATDLLTPPRPADPPPKEEPSILTPETKLNQAVEIAAPEPSAPPEQAPKSGPPARRVYGVRKVFARGLGTGSGGGEGLVVKRGNTLDGRADTLTATEADLRAPATPFSQVEQAPVPVRQVKPSYSSLLLQNRVSGAVKARLLIDTDGTVRSVEILEDIGYDSREIAASALREFRFRPATRGGEPVAVWILYQIRFEYQE